MAPSRNGACAQTRASQYSSKLGPISQRTVRKRMHLALFTALVLSRTCGVNGSRAAWLGKAAGPMNAQARTHCATKLLCIAGLAAHMLYLLLRARC